jgi:hypothetical protein
MESAGPSARAGTKAPLHDDEEHRPPQEIFEILEPDLEYGVSRKSHRSWWSLWPNMEVRSRRRGQEEEEDEIDGLLVGRDGSLTRHPLRENRCRRCVNGGNTALSIL